MTPSKCPAVLECPEVRVILEQHGSDQWNVLDDTVLEKVINICAACIEPQLRLAKRNQHN